MISWLHDSGQQKYGYTSPRAWSALNIDWVVIDIGAYAPPSGVGPLGDVIGLAGDPAWSNGVSAPYRLPQL